MPIVDHDWQVDFRQNFTGIAGVSLYQQGGGVVRAALAGGVAPYAAGAVAEQISLVIAGQRSGKLQVVDGAVAFGVDDEGKNTALQLAQRVFK